MTRPTIARVHLVASPRLAASARVPGAAALAVEYPTVEIVCAPRPCATDAIVGVDAWTSAADFSAFDAAIAGSTSDGLTICGEASALARVATEVLTRWQRHIDRRNDASGTLLFDAVMRSHAALHDVTMPLVRADLDHAIDTWQWVLRLEPEASLAAQLAALFHDLERLDRLESEPDLRAGDLAETVLCDAGVDRAVAARVREIVAAHERRRVDAEVDLLDDADALSFFSLDSAGYADRFGPEQTRAKIRETLGRLCPEARLRLATIRLRRDIGQHVAHVEASA